MAPIPITLITGFLGVGKTTLILNLVPQLRAANPNYRLAIIKNEFGDVAVDSQLAAVAAGGAGAPGSGDNQGPTTPAAGQNNSTNTDKSAQKQKSGPAIVGVRELLNGCICCNLVGGLQSALEELRDLPGQPGPPDRIIIETSGSAFPATLAMEVNRLARQSVRGELAMAAGEGAAVGGASQDTVALSDPHDDGNGKWTLDGVISVIDTENWQGYEDTSLTAQMQAQYTDLTVLNKWEKCGERRLDEVLDRIGDLGIDMPTVKSDRGWVDANIVFGVDRSLARAALMPATVATVATAAAEAEAASTTHGHGHDHHSGAASSGEHHTSEVEVLSVTLSAKNSTSSQPVAVDAKRLMQLLLRPPKDEVYRIKGILTVRGQVHNDDDDMKIVPPPRDDETARWILNWAFKRWIFTRFDTPHGVDDGRQQGATSGGEDETGVVARLTFILARYESKKWTRRLEQEGWLVLADGAEGGQLVVKRVS